MVENKKEEGINEETKVEMKPKWIIKDILNFKMLEANGIGFGDFMDLKQGRGNYDLVIKFMNVVLEGPEITNETNLLDPEFVKINKEMGFLG